MKTKHTLFFTLIIKTLWAFQPVDINQASVEQIALLPGVGEKLAQNIKDHRKKGLLHEEDLLKIDGMTPKKLEKMRAHLFFGSRPKKTVVLKKSLPLLKMPMIGLRELEMKALSAEGLGREIDEDLKKRARIFAWLPEVSAMMDMGRNSFSTEKKLESRSDYNRRDGVDFGFGLKASFNLEKLIFNSSELDVQKLSLMRMKKREELINKLHKSYFNYLRLQEREAHDVKEGKAIEIELKEEKALMDSMSQGAFSRFQESQNLGISL